MLKKTLVAVATTVLLAVGSIGATTVTASAGPDGPPSRHWDNGQRHWNKGRHWDNGRHHGWRPHHPRRICRDVVREKRVWTHHGWRWRPVVVGQRCSWARW